MRDFLYPLRVIHGRLSEHAKEKKRLSMIQKTIQAENKNTILFVLTPTHGNLGDHAIAVAVSNMLWELNLPYLEITADELKLMEKYKAMRLMNGRSIIVNGGGNIGTLWPSVENLFRSIVRGCPESRIICLPNTAFFEESEQGRFEYLRSEQIYRRHDALTICARESISYEILKQMHDDVVLIPDMVLSMNECKKEQVRKGCLLCLRSDREKTRDEETDRIILSQVAQVFQNHIFYSDMNIEKTVSAECRKYELTRKFDAFRSAELVITDRLHGMIYAAITGTPCVVIDSKSPKVRGCYEWLQKLEYIRFVENPKQIAEVFCQLTKKTYEYTNDHLQPYYRELKKYLQDMLPSEGT